MQIKQHSEVERDCILKRGLGEVGLGVRENEDEKRHGRGDVEGMVSWPEPASEEEASEERRGVGGDSPSRDKDERRWRATGESGTECPRACMGDGLVGPGVAMMGTPSWLSVDSDSEKEKEAAAAIRGEGENK